MDGPRKFIAAHPARIGMLSVLPLIIAGFQLANAVIYDLPLGLPLAFSGLMVAFAIAAFVSLRATFQVAVLEGHRHK